MKQGREKPFVKEKRGEREDEVEGRKKEWTLLGGQVDGMKDAADR